MELVVFVVGSAIALIGVYFAHSLRRQLALKVAEQRLESYRKLWELMEVARPMRTEAADGSGPLTREEAHELYRAMPHWYFGSGDGMLLTSKTREFYLKAKANLGEYAVGDDPDWQSGGERCARDLSLLRRQMARDLDLYGSYYFKALDSGDEEFLKAAGADPKRWGRGRGRSWPWRRPATPAVRSAKDDAPE